MTAIRLTIVSTRPADAALYVLGVDAVPAWAQVLSDSAAVYRLPDGSRCIGIFYEPRRHRSRLEWAWIERRLRGGILGLTLEEIEGIAQWRDRLLAAGGTGAHLGPPPPEVAGMVISERRVP